MARMSSYFEIPKQVIFADPENSGEWLCGIAFRDEIICACCGGTYDIAEVEDLAAEDGLNRAIYVYENWVDLAEEIAGGALPDGLIFDVRKEYRHFRCSQRQRRSETCH